MLHFSSVETDIREYAESLPVSISLSHKTNRLVLSALNEGGCNGTDIDLLDVISWLKKNMPELINLNKSEQRI